MKSLPARIRAIDELDKSKRRRAILDAARDSLQGDFQQLPSVSEIAQVAGLAKGTLYLYFKTKEAIFLALLSELYEQLLDAIFELVVASSDARMLTARFTQCLDEFTRQQPHFLPLAAMANSVIERNVTEAEVVDFKLLLVERLQAVGEQLHRLFPNISSAAGSQLLLHTHALMIGLWQMQSWPSPLREIMQEPRFALVAPDFSAELERSVKALWSGTLLG